MSDSTEPIPNFILMLILIALLSLTLAIVIISDWEGVEAEPVSPDLGNYYVRGQ